MAGEDVRARSGELVGRPGATLGETVRRTLLDMIMYGHFAQGDRLYPERLAEQFGVSITPVREALMQLAAEGFIEAVQRRGYHIRSPDAPQVTNLWQVRQGLELTAGEICIDRLLSGTLKTAEIEGLADIQRAQEDPNVRIRHVDKLELNNQFHSRIIELSGNALLISLYRGIQIKVLGSLVQRGLDTWRERLGGEAAEHWAIVEALRHADHAAYATAVRAHLGRSLKDALRDLADRNKGGEPA